jgi:hypothetical protein
MEIINEDCYWCEEKLTRTTVVLPWIGEHDNFICLFHPANFDAIRMEATGETCFHQTMEEVYEIIIAHHETQKAMRLRAPLRAVSDNAVIVGKKAQRTSRAAAQSIQPRSGTIRYRVHQYFQGRGVYGATDDEAQNFLGIDGNTFRPTRKTLVDDGYLIDSGRTRKNENGHDCIVWVERGEHPAFFFDA